MKAKFTLIVMLICSFCASKAQQVPNGGFETWTDAYAPTGWTSYEEIIPQIQGIGLIHKDSVDVYQGSYSVFLTSQYVALASDTIAGAVALGTGVFNGSSPQITGPAFAFSPDTLQFAYKYTTANPDTAGVEITLKKADTSSYKLEILDQLLSTDGQWVIVTIPLKQYYLDTTGLADTLNLQFTASAKFGGNKPFLGDSLHVDAVRFGYVTAPTLIEEINNNLTTSLYPNPAKDILHFSLSEVQNNASIMVFDMTGRVLTHEFVSGNNFDLYTGRWSSGIYTYSLISNNVVVNKGKFVIEK